MNYRLAFQGPIKPAPGNALRSRVEAALGQEDFRSLTVVFSTGGGDTREGLALYNFFRSLPHPVHMHAAGHVDSMGVPIYLAGTTRTCSPTSRFYFHPFSWNFDSAQRLDGMDDVASRFENDVLTARRIVTERANLPPVLADTLYGRGSSGAVVDPGQAVEWGLAQSIRELNPVGETQPDTTLWTVTW